MPRSLKLSVLFTGLLVLIIDQIIKFVIIKKIPADGIFFVKTHFLTFGFLPTLNPFIAFGLRMPTVLIFLLFAVIILLVLYLAKKSDLNHDRLATCLLIAIIASAFSNFIDRLLHSGVVDFISLTIYGLSWATFNLADAVIVITLIALIIKKPKIL